MKNYKFLFIFVSVIQLLLVLFLIKHVSSFEIDSVENVGSGDSVTHGHGHRNGIQIAKFDFKLVHTPFLIALWILAASFAKIGKERIILVICYSLNKKNVHNNM